MLHICFVLFFFQERDLQISNKAPGAGCQYTDNQLRLFTFVSTTLDIKTEAVREKPGGKVTASAEKQASLALSAKQHKAKAADNLANR